MKLFMVTANNHRDYEDKQDYDLLIGAETKKLAEEDAEKMWSSDPYTEAYDVVASEITKTDNGIMLSDIFIK